MNDFFKPWQRKTGCITLALALVFTSGWLRSQYWMDSVYLNLGGRGTLSIQSLASGIDIGRMTVLNGSSPAGWDWRWDSQELSWLANQWVETNGNRKEIDPWMDHIIEWRRDWLGFHFGAGYVGNRRDEDWMIPYWSIVSPLTLLSAYLLLTKPRIVKPNIVKGEANSE